MKYQIDLKEIPRLKKFSIIAKPIEYGNFYLMPTNQFEFLVNYDSEYKLYLLDFKPTGTFLTGASLDIIDAIMHEELVFLWEMYAKEDDNKLLEDSRQVKYFMLANYREVPK